MKQQRLFAFVRRYVRENDACPTTSEIAGANPDLTDDTVRYNLRALVRADYLRSDSVGGTSVWSPTGERALAEAALWRLVDDGLISWSGGKPKGSKHPVKLIGEGYISDFVHQDRR